MRDINVLSVCKCNEERLYNLSAKKSNRPN
jgi:hypothetical protein